MANMAHIAGHVEVEDRVIIGGLSGIHQFVRLGSGTMTGGYSRLIQDVPPFLLCDGNPAYVRGINIVGLKRQNFSRESIGEILEAHRIYYRSELKSDEALRVIEETFGESVAVRAFLDFIYSTEGSGKH